MSDIPYTIYRRKRVKYMRLEVGSDCSVSLIVPFSVSQREIDRFLHEKARWLARAVEKMAQRKSLPAEGTREEFLKYKEVAREILTKKVEYWNQYYHFEYQRIAIKNLVSQWGSCSSKGNLNFNYKTIFLPEEQSDYIVVHELCHLREMNHGKRFWALVSQTIPNYKELEKVINNMRLR